MNKKQKKELRKKNKNKKKNRIKNTNTNTNTNTKKIEKYTKKQKGVLCFNCMSRNEIDYRIEHQTKTCIFCNSELLLNDRYYLFDKLGENIGITYLVFDTKTQKKSCNQGVIS